MATATRQRLTEAAARRFYRDGFRNVGLEQVLADVGISKTAFYKHFDCKEDLVLAALEMRNLWFQEYLRASVREGGPTPIAQLRALMDVVHRIIETDDFQGCIFVNVAMEYPAPHDPAHVAAAAHKKAVEEIVSELAERAGAAEPRKMARELCLTMEGAYVTRQVSGDSESITVARRIAEMIIAAHLPGSRSGNEITPSPTPDISSGTPARTRDTVRQ